MLNRTCKTFQSVPMSAFLPLSFSLVKWLWYMLTRVIYWKHRHHQRICEGKISFKCDRSTVTWLINEFPSKQWPLNILNAFTHQPKNFKRYTLHIQCVWKECERADIEQHIVRTKAICETQNTSTYQIRMHVSVCTLQNTNLIWSNWIAKWSVLW